MKKYILEIEMEDSFGKGECYDCPICAGSYKEVLLCSCCRDVIENTYIKTGNDQFFARIVI